MRSAGQKLEFQQVESMATYFSVERQNLGALKNFDIQGLHYPYRHNFQNARL